jgi:hypothetical protein
MVASKPLPGKVAIADRDGQMALSLGKYRIAIAPRDDTARCAPPNAPSPAGST